MELSEHGTRVRHGEVVKVGAGTGARTAVEHHAREGGMAEHVGLANRGRGHGAGRAGREEEGRRGLERRRGSLERWRARIRGLGHALGDGRERRESAHEIERWRGIGGQRVLRVGLRCRVVEVVGAEQAVERVARRDRTRTEARVERVVACRVEVAALVHVGGGDGVAGSGGVGGVEGMEGVVELGVGGEVERHGTGVNRTARGMEEVELPFKCALG